MQDQRVRVDHLHGAAALIHRKAIVQLDCAQVRQEQDVRRNVADAKRGGGSVLFQTGALAAQPHRQPARLGGFGQTAVDELCLRRAAGHGANQDRRGHRLFPHLRARVDIGQVQFRQGLMDQSIVFQPGGEGRKLDVFLQIDADMVGFALIDAHGMLFSSPAATRGNRTRVDLEP